MRPACLLALVVLLAPAAAAADVVGPEENISCPEGSRASTNHCGTICYAPPCASDADCESGQRCAMVPYCVEELMCGRGGAITNAVRDTCTDGCSAGTCTPLRTCFDADRVEGDGTVAAENVTYGCGCRVGSGRPAPALGLLALLGLLWARRR